MPSTKQGLWKNTKLLSGETHEDFLKEHAHNHTLGELVQIIGRSEKAVENKLGRMGLMCKRELLTQMVDGLDPKKLLAFMKDEPRRLKEISIAFDRSESTIENAIRTLQNQAYEIIESEEQVVWSTRATAPVTPPATLWDEEYGQFLLGLISDTHGGSKWAQITNLRRCIETMYEMGVRDFLFTGDLVAGHNVYRGQIHDIVTPSGPEQVRLMDSYWPDYDDVKWRFLGGNHDFSFIKAGGYNPVRDFCSLRENRKYVGYDLADIPITPVLDARLWHPMGGVPYAYSYRLQKMVEEVAFEQLYKVLESKKSSRVSMLYAGHLHIYIQFWAGPILCIQVGCFEGKTPYLKRKAKTPFIGGAVVEFQITSSQLLRKVSIHQLQFTEIDNDYIRYPVPRREEEVLEPLFQWTGEGGG